MEEIYSIRGFKCVKSQLMKTNGKCPCTNKAVMNPDGTWNWTEIAAANAEMAARGK